MSIHRAYIIDAVEDSDVEVEVDDDLSFETLLDIEDQWALSRNELRGRLRAANIPRPDWPQSLHWDWRPIDNVVKLVWRPFGWRWGSWG